MMRRRAVAGRGARVDAVAVGVGGELLVDRGGVRGVAEQGRRLRELAQRRDPVHVVCQPREVIGHDPFDVRARVIGASLRRVQPGVAAAVGRLRRPADLALEHLVADRVEALVLNRDAMALDLDVQRGVLVVRAAPDRREVLDQPIGVVEAALEQRDRRAPHRSPPLVRGQPQPVGELLVALDLARHLGDVATLGEVEHAPVAALHLALGIARAPGQRDHLVGGREALVEIRAAPQRDMARVERVEQRAVVAARASERDGPVAERLALLGDRRVVRLDGKAGDEPCRQRVVVRARVERLAQQRHRAVVDRDDRHAEAAEAERRTAEQLGVVKRAGDIRGAGERGPRRRALAGAVARLPEREQQVSRASRRRLARGGRALQRGERALAPARRLLVGELRRRLLRGVQRGVDARARCRPPGNDARARRDGRASPAPCRASSASAIEPCRRARRAADSSS